LRSAASVSEIIITARGEKEGEEKKRKEGESKCRQSKFFILLFDRWGRRGKKRSPH